MRVKTGHLKQRWSCLCRPLLPDEVAASRRHEVRNRNAVTQKFLVYLAPEQIANWIQVYALVLF